MTAALFVMDPDLLSRIDDEHLASFVLPRIGELWEAASAVVALGCSAPTPYFPRATAEQSFTHVASVSDAAAQLGALQLLAARGIQSVYLVGRFEVFAFDAIVDGAEQLGLALRVIKDCCSFAAPDEIRVAYGSRPSVTFLQSVEALTRLSPMTTTTKFEGRYLRVFNRAGWEFVERTRGKEVVVLVPLIDGEVIFVEQYRAPLDRVVIELPAGLVGDNPDLESESFQDAAQRELLEETGYEPGRLEWLTSGPCSAGLSNEVVHVFLATDLVHRHAGGGDATEEIITHRIAVTDADAWLTAKITSDSCLVDPKVYIGLYFVDRYLRHGDRSIPPRG